MSIRRMALILVFALVGSPAFAQTSIDDFAAAQAQLQAAASCSGASCSFAAGAMLGSERDIRTQLFSGTGAATAEVTGGAFAFNGVGTAFAEARLVWDGADGNADTTAFTGLAGVNLTTGADSIILDVNSASSGAVVIVEVFTNATSSSLYTLWLPPVAAATSFAFPFTAFTPHLGSGATFTNVGAVSLTVRGPGATLSLDAIRAGMGAAPAVAASKTVAISNDLGRAGSAEPGDTIKYTIQVDNKSGKPTSANTGLVDVLDANLTLVPGSTQASPIGIEDYYFQSGASLTTLAPGVLGNDVDPDGDAKSVATPGSITTTQGATATVNADGSFSVAIPGDGSLDTFTYEVTDGNGITSPAVVTVGLLPNVAPVLANGSSVAYTENATALTINTAITVNDADSPTLSTGTVSITANLSSGEDLLSFTNVPGTMGNVAGVYTPGTGVMALTSSGSTATLVQWQAALQAVKYSNTSDNPSTSARTVSFVVNDGSANSNTVTSTVSVTSVNDAPVLTAGATLNYTENQAATVVEGTVTVADPDSATIASATVQITGACTNPQDVLSFSTQNGISGVYTAASCLMTLSGSSSVSNYQAALRSVMYSNTSDNPTTSARTVTWQVNDGAGVNNLSNQPTSTINVTAVNDAPAATAGASLNYTENQAATAIDTTITVSDVDSTNLTGATVQITASYAMGQDLLSYTTALGISGVFNTGSGTLTLTGTTTVANYQTALRNVKYNNTSENPTTLARTVSWQVNDGAGANNLSTVVTSTINVTAVNDSPVAATRTSAAQANMKVIGVNAGLTTGATDPDNGVNGCTVIYSVASITAGSFGTISNVNLGAGTFDFDPNPGFTGTATVNYTLSDGGNCGTGGTLTSVAATVNITVSGPVIWFVDASVAGPGDGRLSNPFKFLSGNAGGNNDADDVDTANQRIFLASGNYASAFSLLPGESLIGQGVSTVSNPAFTTFDAVFGITPPANTIARPAINGTRPVIQGTLTLASTAQVRGLDLSTGAFFSIIDPSAAISGVVVSQVAVTSTGLGMALSDTTGGSFTFDGVSGGRAVQLTGTNTGTTFNFSNVVGSSGSSDAFVATGGGTVNVTGATNTLTSTTGTALNVSNTTIGASGLTFRSISSNGAANGIVLSGTGASGGLTVTGTGATNGSGGTIQNITNRGLSAVGTTSVSLSNMNFTNANTNDSGSSCGAANNSGCNAAIHLDPVTGAVLTNVHVNGAAQQGINVREVSGFQLVNSSVINGGAGGQTEEADLYAINMFGTCAITNSSLTVPAERAAVIYNTSKTLDLTVTGSTFGMNQTQPLGADGLEVSSYGASNTTLRVVNSTFVQPKTNGLQVITEGTSVSSVDITGSTFDPGTGLAAAIDLDVNNTANMKFNISNNPSIKGKGINIVNVFAFPNATFEGRINNNVVTHNGGSGAAIRVVSQGDGNSRVEIKDNTVTGADDQGITVVSQLGSGRVDTTITGNSVSVGNSGFYAIAVAAGNSGSTSTNKVCANVASNSTTAPGGAIGNFQARAATAPHQILLQGSGANVAANWSANSNTPVPGIVSQSGTGAFAFGATCLVPTNPLP